MARIETEPLPGVKVGITVPDPPEPAERLRKVPGKIDEPGLDIIKDAISLKRATMAHVFGRLSDGEALVLICEQWTKAESARLSDKGGTP